jgi:IrrE N-terminal-like domain
MSDRVEAIAEELLHAVPGYIWDGRTLPVPVEDIADSHAGLLVRDVEDLASAPGAPQLASDQSLSGLLLPELGEIWVNAQEGREWPGRRRFTIAHELGHWRLHRHDHSPVYCRPTAIDPGLSAERPPLPLPEEEANVFAAALLMPAAMLREQYVACDRDFDRLCAKFGASGAAMGRRLHAVI